MYTYDLASQTKCYQPSRIITLLNHYYSQTIQCFQASFTINTIISPVIIYRQYHCYSYRLLLAKNSNEPRAPNLSILLVTEENESVPCSFQDTPYYGSLVIFSRTEEGTERTQAKKRGENIKSTGRGEKEKQQFTS